MKATLKVSISLNLVLLGGMIFILANQREKRSAAAPVLSESKPPAETMATSVVPVPASVEPAPFRWSQLMSGKDYRVYIANLHAAGCPEATIEDIVRGDTERAFAWERNQLSLDGTGHGPWSQAREAQLVASLLSGQSSTETGASAQSTENPGQGNHDSEVAQASGPPQNEGAAAPAYPLFLQNPDWGALGFTAEQQAAIAQVRQQFQNEISSLNQNPGDAANQNAGTTSAGGTPSNSNPNGATALTQWQSALQNADDQLQALLGTQGYAAYEQQQYYLWYQPQVLANAGRGSLTINPEAFSSK